MHSIQGLLLSLKCTGQRQDIREQDSWTSRKGRGKKENSRLYLPVWTQSDRQWHQQEVEGKWEESKRKKK